MLLRHVNYFEPKAIETLRAHEHCYLSLKEFELGVLPEVRVTTRNNCRDASYMAEQTSIHWASALPIVPQVTLSFLPNVRYFVLSPKCLYTAFDSWPLSLSCTWGSHKPMWLNLVIFSWQPVSCCFIRPPGKTWKGKGKFLPLLQLHPTKLIIIP